MYGISVSLSTQFIHYLSDPTDIEEAIYEAYGLFDSGVECIFNLAGPSASGVITAAIDALQWEVPAYVVGVDYDSYLEGLYDGDTSVVLTSAMKFYGTAVYKIMESYARGDFPGGTNMMLDLASGGVGLPQDNLGFSQETTILISDILNYVESGELDIPVLGEYPIEFDPLPISIPTILPLPSETPTLPPIPSETPTLPPVPSLTPTIPPLP